MESLLSIAQLITLICVSALCVFLIVVTMRVKNILGNIEKDVRAVTSSAVPVLENMEYISSQARNIADKIDDQVAVINDSLGSIRQVADDVVALERKVQSRLEGPVLDGVAFVAALFKGVRTFVERLRA